MAGNIALIKKLNPISLGKGTVLCLRAKVCWQLFVARTLFSTLTKRNTAQHQIKVLEVRVSHQSIDRKAIIAVGAVIAVLSFVELILTLSDNRIIVPPGLRNWALQNGAFWVGLLYDWRPNYSGQAFAMFISYAFIHSSLFHLLGNAVALIFVSMRLLPTYSWRSFLWLYLWSVLGGAIAFAVLSITARPMVGASGAIFGLFAAYLVTDYANRKNSGQSQTPVYLMVTALIGLNALVFFLLGGLLAWQTHLGGFLAGALYAIIQNRWSLNTAPE